MGPTVRLLDNTLIDQIAAGEVIERPANLVKELLENAIDAGATEITVSVEDGGRGQVQVRDDGLGMSAEDARLSIERHATSKIASFDDLVKVSTLGFRGEALPSIGSVSRMTITTRARASLEGTQLLIEGGALLRVAPAGCPPGTTVEVQDLFYNVPARKKFLRARQTETSRVFEVCQRVALSHPELRLLVRSDGRVARQYLPAKNLAERAYQVFGELALQEIHAEREGLILDAALAPPELARAGARQLFLMVNGRPISDRAIARAVAFAYGDRLPPGHYPRGVVSIRMPPEEVDVNAHPQKTEVRFKRAAHLLDLVTKMIAARLPATPAGDAYWEGRIGGAGPSAEQNSEGVNEPPPNAALAEPTSDYRPRNANGLRFITQVQSRAIVCDSESEVLILDRELADSIVRQEALNAASNLARQNLLFPDRLELPLASAEALESHGELLRSLAFDWTHLGKGTFVVRAVPALLADARPAALFQAALRALDAKTGGSRQAVLEALASAAATPNGKPLDDESARRIVSQIQPERNADRRCILGRTSLPMPKSER